jgi:hypothetical protein
MDTWGTTISQTTNSLNAHAWPKHFVSAFGITVFVAAAFGTTTSFGRWLTYICFAICLIALMARSTINTEKNVVSKAFQFQGFQTTALQGALFLVFPQAAALIFILNHSPNVPEFVRTIASLGAMVAAFFIGSYLFLGDYKAVIKNLHFSGAIFILSLLSLITLTLGMTRIGGGISHIFKGAPISAFFICLAIGAMFGTLFSAVQIQARVNLLSKRFISLFLIVISLALSFRADSIFKIEGARYHWSYFVGVIDSIRSGGTLLWNTPSQYGLGPALVPALLPFESSVQSFFFFQACLTFCTVVFVLFLIGKFNSRPSSFLILGASWVLIYFFADPELIGPQPYPSSSAMRFGPSLILLAALILQGFSKHPNRRPVWQIGSLNALVGVSFWWSSESALYSTCILGSYCLYLLVAEAKQQRKKHLIEFLIQTFPGILLIGAGVIASVFFRVGNLPDFSMFFMYSRGYSLGFGSYPLEFASVIWLPAVLLVLLASVRLVYSGTPGSESLTKTSFLLVGGLGAWSSYYIGRAVPDNVIAMMPLYAFGLIALTSLLLSQNGTLDFKKDLRASTTPTAAYGLTIIAVSGILFTAVISQPLTNIFTPGWLSSISSSTLVSSWKSQNATLTQLENAFKSLPLEMRSLPIAYEGSSGTLPIRHFDSNQMFNFDEMWLPAPLGLLEEPILPLKQSEIVSRFVSATELDGLFVVDRANSFPERVQRWKEVIAKTHQCSSAYEDEDIHVEHCVFND